jgi:probable O-glycosylation ligase (exosortase A-associated)
MRGTRRTTAPVRDLALIGFLVGLLAFGLKRPFLFVLAYAYVDIVSPQRLSYYLLNSIPISLVVFSCAVVGWMLSDDKRNMRVAPRQMLLLMLLLYCGYTTLFADFPVEALEKWGWVWKALVFAIFLPLTLRTKLRIESLLLFMVLSASSIVVVGGIKTAFSGGGYGSLNLMVDNNSGLYEGSTISTVAVAIVPIIWFLAQHGTIFPKDRRVITYAAALTFACLLIPVGTEARTGLICIGLLAVLLLRDIKRRMLYLSALAALGIAAIPFLPSSFTDRMETIQNHQADSSASTRLAVWGWTWDYVQRHPMGGGFNAFLQNDLRMERVQRTVINGVEKIETVPEVQKSRAYHSAYFEMLGEQGFPGFFLWLAIHGSGLLRMEVLRRRFIKEQGEKAWIAPLASALQQAQLIYMVGSLFVGIAFQPFILMLIGIQIGFDTYVARITREERWIPFGAALRAKKPLTTS